MADIRFDGKVAIVTGAGGGLGRQHALELARRGAKVLVNDLGGSMDGSGGNSAAAEAVVAEIKAMGGEAIANGSSVTDDAGVAKMIKDAMDAWGRIDILIANAGIAGANASTWDTTVDEWRKVMRINLDGPFLCAKAVVPGMIAQNYGRIVNVASIAGKEGNPNAAHYSASKAGVIALTKSLGKELAKYDIAVNAITPAAAKTAIFDQITQNHIDFMLSKIPRNRFVTVEEMAAMVAFMASADNSFTTGAVFDLSGGRATY